MIIPYMFLPYHVHTANDKRRTYVEFTSILNAVRQLVLRFKILVRASRENAHAIDKLAGGSLRQ